MSKIINRRNSNKADRAKIVPEFKAKEETRTNAQRAQGVSKAIVIHKEKDDANQRELILALGEAMLGSEPIDAEIWKTDFEPILVEGLESVYPENTAKSKCSMFKQIIIELSHGYKPSNEVTNLNTLAKEARKVRDARKAKAGEKLTAKPGRPEGTTNVADTDEAGDVALEFAALFGGTRKEQRVRAELLLNVVEKDPHGKLFDKLLADILAKK